MNDQTPSHPWAVLLPPSILDLLRSHVGEEFADLLPRFIRGMVDRMLTSAPKYGRTTPAAVAGLDWPKSIQLRLDKFQDDGNTEWLMDVANFMVIMSTFPCHPRWHFRSTDSHESPGYIAADQTHRFHPQDQAAVERHLRRQQGSGD